MLKDWESSLNKFSSNIFYWVIKVESVEKFQFLVRILQSNCWRCWCDGNMIQTLSDYWHHTLMLDISHPEYVTDTWLTVKMNCEVDASPWVGICVKYFLDDVHNVMTPDQAVLGFKSDSEPCSGPVTRSVSPALSSLLRPLCPASSNRRFCSTSVGRGGFKWLPPTHPEPT